jgi:uncharacterized membrane protein
MEYIQYIDNISFIGIFSICFTIYIIFKVVEIFRDN